MILTKALGFSWQTTMALLFLVAPDHRITSQALEGMKTEFAGLNVETSQNVLKTYRSRRQEAGADSVDRRLPQLHAQ